MKRIYMIIAAALTLAACAKNVEVTRASLVATTESDTKTYLDGLSIKWEKSDAISVFSTDVTGAFVQTKFATTEEGATATFKGDGITIDGNTYAIYPYDASAAFTAADGFTANFSTSAQTVKAGGFASGLNVAVGKCDADKKASFRNVGAYLKFTLTQERADTLRRIEIKANGGRKLVFDGAAKIAWNNGSPVITPEAGAVLSDAVTLTGDLATGSTYYVWVMPGDYSDGITVTLVTPTQMTAAKVGAEALRIDRNQVVDLGSIGGLSYKQKQAETRTLTFDFSTCPEGWPDNSTYSEKDTSPREYGYTIGGTEYSFVVAPCPDAGSRGTCWGYSAAGDMFFLQVHRYLGLPALAGEKLVKVAFVMSASSNTGRKAGITSSVVNSTEEKTFITGGEPIVVGTQGEEYSFLLEGTEANTRYYLCGAAKAIGLTILKLTYEKVQ